MQRDDTDADDAVDAASDAPGDSPDARDGSEDARSDAPGDSPDADAAVEGVDTEHVMNLTFVLTLVVGVPVVVVLSLFVPLDGWSEIIGFVVRVGAAIWFLTAVSLYVRERVRN